MKIKNNFELGRFFTFESSKKHPVHNWFYYKEGFSPEMVEFAIENEKTEGTVLDPFCGAGTTLLSSKKAGLQSIGIDVSPLAAFVSQVKCDDYNEKDIESAKKFISTVFKERKEPKINWQFELFPPSKAFPKSNLNTLLFLREEIENEEPKVRNLLLLALLSVFPQSSLVIKDGGVLKINKRKRAIPMKEIFRRKVKRMLSDLENPIKGPKPGVFNDDARLLPVENDIAELIVTSPPYLNNIDYSKIYGLELSLLFLDKNVTQETRRNAVRSFITGDTKLKDVPQEVGDIGYQIPVIGAYFADMERVLSEIYRVMKPDASCYFVVSNSVIHETHVLVDEVLGEIGERLGFDVEILVGAERIADVRPKKVKTRESAIVFRK